MAGKFFWYDKAMITFIRGPLAAKVSQSPRGAVLIVDVQGIGYEILTNSASVASAPPVGEEIQVFTSLIVREDAMSLVGFISKEERDLFNILQSASGVGVRVALALLSELSVSEIVQAVVAGEYKPLTAAKGVGLKLAQKMTLELKEKMVAWRDVSPALTMQAETVAGFLPQTEAFVEAETVLLSLGYTHEEIRSSLQATQQKITETAPSSEAILRESLRWLAQV